MIFIDVIQVIIDFIPIFSSVICALLLFLSLDMGLMTEESTSKRILLVYFALTTVSSVGVLFRDYFPMLYTQLNLLFFFVSMLIPIALCDWIVFLTSAKRLSRKHYLLPCVILGAFLIWWAIAPAEKQLPLLAKYAVSSLLGAFYILRATQLFIRYVLRADLKNHQILKHIKGIGVILAVAILLQVLILIGITLPQSDYFTRFWSVVTIIVTLALHVLFIFYMLRRDLYATLHDYEEIAEDKIELSGEDIHAMPTVLQETQSQPTKKLNKKDFEKFVKSNKPYLDPDYKITDMVAQLKVNRAYISRFINGTYGMNFNVYINSLRLAELERLKKLSANKQKKVAELITMAGFHNYRTYMRAKNEK